MKAIFLSYSPEGYTLQRHDREFTDAARAGIAHVLQSAFPGSGYLHGVGVTLEHRGKRLGELVSLPVPHEFVRLGMADTVLNTDDFRLPAIKTYYRLGFSAEMAPLPTKPPGQLSQYLILLNI